MASRRQDESFWALRERWIDRLLGADREDEPASHHVAYIRRMSPLAGLYTKERSVPVCLETLDRLGFDLARTSASGSTSTTGRRRTRAPA